MKHMIFPVLILQLFADGGDGAPGGAEMGVGQNPTGKEMGADLSTVRYGRVQEAQIPTEQEEPEVKTEPAIDRAERWKTAKAEFKDEYGKDVKAAVDQRFKGKQALLDRAEAQTPLIERVASRYGIDPSDIPALMKAWDNDAQIRQADEMRLEQEALEKGMSVDQLRAMKQVEMENASLRRQMEERQKQEGINRIQAKWIADGETLKTVYPNFDLETELKNKDFSELLMAGINMQKAYEVTHLNELVPSAMQFAAQSAAEKVSKFVTANLNRPRENGMNAQAGARTKSDPSKLTNADLAEIERRVARGERISF